MANQQGWILQVEAPQEGPLQVAKVNPCILIPDRAWLRQFDPRVIVGQHVKEKTGVVPPAIAAQWGMQNGSCVVFEAGQKAEEVGKIITVDGISDPGICCNLPKIIGPEALPAHYASRRLDLDFDGDLNCRIAMLLAPVGLGQRWYLIAPPKSGKTWMFRSIWKSALRLLSHMPKLYVIGLHVGERAEDGTALQDILRETLSDTSRAELYQTPDGDRLEAHVWLTQWVVDRARRLTSVGYDVVLMIDCISRVAMSHSRSEILSGGKSGGMISGGLKTASVALVKQLLAVAGNFGKGSLTIITTMLSEEQGTTSSESAIAQEMGPSSSTATLGLVSAMPQTEYPRVDVSERRSSTRESQRFQGAHILEMQLVQELMWAPILDARGKFSRVAKAPDALRRLQEYARQFPIPSGLRDLELVRSSYVDPLLPSKESEETKGSKE